ncbi:MAG: glycosyltransferase family 39 protein [Acidobacteria bacterium]|nr:glycosyltransferase family 39 protein [Acidobacteriota bacterium]
MDRTAAIDRPLIWTLIIAAIAVHLTGLFDPIFSGDSALYAVIAKSFVTTGDWMNIYVNGTDWLDKPHFPFWLEAASMKVFGISAFAYKLPALLLFLVGLWYTYRLAKELYNEDIALVAVLVLVTSLHLFISNNDIRAEAMLIGLIMGGVYHFYRSTSGGSIWHVVAGAAFCAAAIMTKGPFVLIVFAAPIAVHLLYKKDHAMLFSWRWVLAGLLVTLFTLPELVCLYVQFDMHPEKVVFGQTNVSGIRYFFWETQFGRFLNTGPFRGTGSPLFFLHSLLWTFAPWAILGFVATGSWISNSIRRRYVPEMLTFGGFSVMFVIFSASRFQLPYYTNILFPALSIMCAAFVMTRLGEKSLGVFVMRASLILFLFVLAAGVGGMEYMFGQGILIPVLLTSGIVVIGLAIVHRRVKALDMTLLYTCAGVMTLFALYCNLVFFPRLLSFESGREAAKFINAEVASRKVAASVNDHLLEFYLSTPMTRVNSTADLDRIDQGDNYLFFVDEDFKDQLDANGVAYDTVREFSDYPITRPASAFLNPQTRDSVLDRRYLISLR